MEYLAPEDRYTGTFRHALDTKNRVTVPARWRDDGLNVLFALEDDTLGILKLLPKAELARTGRMVLDRPDIDPEEAREFRRVLFARAMECPVDSQGRVLLPAVSIENLGLGRELVLVGAGERIEIWSPDGWARAERAQLQKFNQIAKEIGF